MATWLWLFNSLIPGYSYYRYYREYPFEWRPRAAVARRTRLPSPVLPCAAGRFSRTTPRLRSLSANYPPDERQMSSDNFLIDSYIPRGRASARHILHARRGPMLYDNNTTPPCGYRRTINGCKYAEVDYLLVATKKKTPMVRKKKNE